MSETTPEQEAYQRAWEDGYAVGYEDGCEDGWNTARDEFGPDEHDAEDARTSE